VVVGYERHAPFEGRRILLFKNLECGNEKHAPARVSSAELLADRRRVRLGQRPALLELAGVNQCHVNVAQGLTFAGILRSVLRQDPDIVLVGEIRDGETADIAVKAALTGHLVLSTLHTNDACGVVARLFDDMYVNMVMAGEKAGKVEDMLDSVADSYDEEVEALLSTLTSLMEPFLMVFLGAVIGTIVLAMFLPIFNMGSLAS